MDNDSPYAHKSRSSISGLAAEISKDKNYTLHQKTNSNSIKSQVQAILLVCVLLAPNLLENCAKKTKKSSA